MSPSKSPIVADESENPFSAVGEPCWHAAKNGDRSADAIVDAVLKFEDEENKRCSNEGRIHECLALGTAHKVLNNDTLASVALLTESEAARVFDMGTTRFKARCRKLGIKRWPHRKLMSLKNLYFDLTQHMKGALASQNHEVIKRVWLDMREIKSYAKLLETDLSLLNEFYKCKSAWPDNVLKIRQSIYKKRHAQVLIDKRNAISNAQAST